MVMLGPTGKRRAYKMKQMQGVISALLIYASVYQKRGNRTLLLFYFRGDRCSEKILYSTNRCSLLSHGKETS